MKMIEHDFGVVGPDDWGKTSNLVAAQAEFTPSTANAPRMMDRNDPRGGNCLHRPEAGDSNATNGNQPAIAAGSPASAERGPSLQSLAGLSALAQGLAAVPRTTVASGGTAGGSVQVEEGDGTRESDEAILQRLIKKYETAVNHGDFHGLAASLGGARIERLVKGAAGQLFSAAIDCDDLQYAGPFYAELVQIVFDATRHLSAEGQLKVARAFLFANFWHSFQAPRQTGEPYISHPIEVMRILARYRMDAATLAAALLHDVVEDHDEGVSLADLARRFGRSVSALDDGLTKISKASAKHRREMRAAEDASWLQSLQGVWQATLASSPERLATKLEKKTPAGASGAAEKRDQKQAEAKRAKEQAEAKRAKILDKAATIKKLIVTMATDLRIILIKLADRLHNMRTLQGVRSDKQKRIATETRDLFCPICNRLGAYEMRSELEELSFKYIEVDAYNSLREELVAVRKSRRLAIEESVAGLREALQATVDGHAIEATVEVCPKPIYSIYRKQLRTGRNLESIYDIDAILITVKTVGDCYEALGRVHGRYAPMTGRNRDYIGQPKSNGYRALHTTVCGANNQFVEVQICTREQQQTNEYGVFAKFYYSDPVEIERRFEEKPGAVFEELSDWTKAIVSQASTAPEEQAGGDVDLLDELRKDLLANEVFAFTPEGKPIDLPASANPIDFAYRVHTDLGHRCVSAYVNGVNVSLTGYIIKNGDVVEIQASDFARPQREWYDCCATLFAKNCISKFLARESHEANVEAGRRLLSAELLRRGCLDFLGNADYLLAVARSLHRDTIDELLFDIGCRRIKLEALGEAVLLKLPEGHKIVAVAGRSGGSRNLARLVSSSGASFDKAQRCRCCSPVLGDKIIGFSTQRGIVKVHAFNCVTANKLFALHPESKIGLTWVEDRNAESYLLRAGFDVKAVVRKKLTADLVDVFDSLDIKLFFYSFANDSNDEAAQIRIVFGAATAALVDELREKVQRIPGVVSVSRVGRLFD